MKTSKQREKIVPKRCTKNVLATRTGTQIKTDYSLNLFSQFNFYSCNRKEQMQKSNGKTDERNG